MRFTRTFRLLSIALLTTSMAILSHAEIRTFTSPDGRTLQAEIQSATPDMVSLKLANGTPLTVPVSKFSNEDQAFIIEWRKANPATIKYNFDASYTKEKTNSSKSSRGNTEVITDDWICNIKLANRSGQSLENVKVDYEIYYSQVNGNQAVTRKVVGTSNVPAIKHLEETTVKTKELKLTTSKLEGGFYYLDGSRSRQKDAIEGVAIKVSHAGQPAFEWASSGVPKGRGSSVDAEKGPGR